MTITDTRGFGQATANSVADRHQSRRPADALRPIRCVRRRDALQRGVASFTDSSPLAVPAEFTARSTGATGPPAPPAPSRSPAPASPSPARTPTTWRTRSIGRPASDRYPVTVTIMDALTGDSGHGQLDRDRGTVPITIQTQNFAVTGGKSRSREPWPPSPTARRGRIPRSTRPRSTGATARPDTTGTITRHQPVHGHRVAHVRTVPGHRPRDDHDHRPERRTATGVDR